MEGLKLRESYVSCRLCEGMVYESHPVCQKCGLEMSSEGIAELAKIEEENIKALDKIYKLRQLSVFWLLFTVAGFLFALMLDLNFYFHLYFWIANASIFFAFIGWNNKYSKIDLTVDDIESVKEKKKEILSIFFCNLVIGLAFNIYLLS